MFVSVIRSWIGISSSWRRGVGPNTVLAAGFDLKVFFTLFPVEPAEVTTADVLAFITGSTGVG